MTTDISAHAPLVVVGIVCVVTWMISAHGLSFSRSTSDFYVASRRVSPWLNASAIAGEYLSAASFLGVAGLIVANGTHGLWFPVGYTAGFLTLLVFVAAPLRRSGAYTIPDFVHLRFRSEQLRRLTAMIVVLTGWLYIVPQLHGASLAMSAVSQIPGWVGPVLVVAVVLPTVLSGGMRSVTIAQAVQYWLKFTALLVPTIFIVLHFGALDSVDLPDFSAVWSAGVGLDGGPGLYRTVSLVFALMLGTLGLSHVLVRFYTNPDGTTARRTTLRLLGLLPLFYILPVILGVIARAVSPDGVTGRASDIAILDLPSTIFSGVLGDLLTALVAGGAFAAFLSTASGLVVSISGVVSQEFFRGTVGGFRIGALIAVAVPLLIGTVTSELALAGAVAMVFTFTASSLAPVVLLGIWWRGITVVGAMTGMICGALLSLAALVLGLGMDDAAPGALLLTYPAVWCIPAAFLITVLVSRWGPGTPPKSTDAVLALLHIPPVRRKTS
ncbi:MAG TPA: cation acetate symporter [Candidatus Nesterenkonia stercoripullorum]|uniref:Cation acetate symporter n=1 Tax=Candidatus Nesterenkonia stercoripullorum TaxID=2838701 RepID=A0A9D1S0K9_9MICC|nr:cation acetate symporter [Candidatus Nesterenkonia stercoripullorum]